MKSSFSHHLEPGKWMFLIYSSPLPIRLPFAVHTRIETVSPTGESHRYEIHFFKNKKYQHLYIDYQEPSTGMGIFIRNKKPRYQSKLLYKLSGGENSLAHKIVTFIDNNIKNYKYKDTYHHIPGPNCNTLTQRVLDHFPEIKLQLPWNAFGKDYGHYSQCQSCGMPLKMDKKQSGSPMYCSSCYEDGKFKRPNITVKEMQKLVDNVLKNEMKRGRLLRKLAVMQIPRLDRWKKK